MDVITQTVLGAVAGQAVVGTRLGRLAAPVGAVAGALPDADVLLRPLADPALPFELHRHFTHALVFIPVGAALAMVPFLVLPAARRAWRLVYLAAFAGIATHGLLDNTTSYGTHLLWPFVAHRTSWDSMSIVDPVFTGIVLLGVLAALAVGRAAPARVGLALALAYIGFGFVQHHRAAEAQAALAASRGHEPVRARVLPSLGQVIVWRSIYEYDGDLYADAVRVAPFAAPEVREGTRRPRVTEDDLPDDGPGVRRIREAFAGFSAFATGFVAAVGPARDGRLVVGDMRISLELDGFAPLWGLAIEPHDPDEVVRATGFPPREGRLLGRLWDDVAGRGEGWREVD